MHLIQVEHSAQGRRVGIVKEPEVVLLDKSITSTFQLFTGIINNGKQALQTLENFQSKDVISYDTIYHSKDDWRILPPVDCPDHPMQCLLSGTGLTHKASAENRQKMHESQGKNHMTDSMVMYLWGEEGGKPKAGEIGVQPEWFYKGNGLDLKGHGQALTVPPYANDGGEEPEIAGIYLVSQSGIPHRIGFTQANEFSDHVMEKKNYLYLAPSKIRNCSIGPELVLMQNFDSIPGVVNIIRNGATHWAKAIHSGESAMAHSLANLEYHHFKYSQHRIPGQLHVHFLGAGAFSFGAGISLQQGDEMHIRFDAMGRPLVNTLQISKLEDKSALVKPLKL